MADTQSHFVSDERWLYEQAVELWGEDFQIDLLIEECAELIEALSIHGIGSAQVVDEVADVQIMVSQARMMVGDAMVEAATPTPDTRLTTAAATMIRLLIHRRRGRAGNDALAKGLATLSRCLTFVETGVGSDKVAKVRTAKLAGLSERVRRGVLR